MRVSHHLTVIAITAGLAALLAGRAEPATQTYTFQLPSFSTSDHFTFNLANSITVPKFHTSNGALALKRVGFTVDYGPSSPLYIVTNNGTTSGFGVLRTTHGVTMTSPVAQIFGPPFGSTASGPPLNPNQV
jgi:hypothetical protein